MEKIERIVVYSGKISLIEEFHSGTILSTPATDHPLVRDHSGRVIFRGESFAGLLRQELVRQFGYECQDFKEPESKKVCSCSVCDLMGHSRIVSKDELGEEYDPSQFHASRLRIRTWPFSQNGSRIRHHVAIDRRFQVAEAHKKLDLEALSKNATAKFEIEVENLSDDEEKALETLFLEMAHGFLTLGGKASAGYGTFKLEKVTKHIYEMDKKSHVLSYLLRREETPDETVRGPVPLIISLNGDAKILTNGILKKIGKSFNNSSRIWGLRVMFHFDIWFPELFLVNDPLEAELIGTDHCCVTDSLGIPWLPPSSMRGVIRNRAEQILQTLNPEAACDPNSSKNSCAAFLNQYKKRYRRLPSTDSLERDDLLCLSCQLFGSTFYGSRLRFLSGQYSPNTEHDKILQDFLAICRFTGGGKDGAKFDAYALQNIIFRGCGIVIEDFELWHLGLLALVFKDLFQGDMWLGFGTRKGYGLAVATSSGQGGLLTLPYHNSYADPGIYIIQNGTEASNELKELLEDAVEAARDRIKNFELNRGE